MNDPRALRVPGPTPVPEPVVAAGARPMIDHRSQDFLHLIADLRTWLPPFFGTEGDVLLLTSSGTGGLEAAIVNTLSPGDRVLAVCSGLFGERFADIAAAFGAQVERLPCDWGRGVPPEAIQAAVAARPDLNAVLLTHNETSTGVTNDIAALAEAIRAGSRGTPPLILVDGISSIGGVPFELDAWGVDVAVTGSQKAWMSPPGLALLALSERAWEAQARSTMPRFYFDLARHRRLLREGVVPSTPAMGVLFALHAAARMMHEEGREAVYGRHHRVAKYFRSGLPATGLGLYAAADFSDTVTAVAVPEGMNTAALLAELQARHGVILGSGQGPLKERIVRVGHMGWADEEDMARVLAALAASVAAAANA